MKEPNMLNFLLGECKAVVDQLPHTCYVFEKIRNLETCPRCRMIIAITKAEKNTVGNGK